MASTLGAIRLALAQTLERSIPGLRVYVNFADTSMEYPCLVIPTTDDITYQNIAIGSENLRFTVPAIFSLYRASSDEALAELDEYRSPVGARSIRKAIKDDNTLGGQVVYANVTRSYDTQRNRDAQDSVWVYSCQFEITILQTVTE